MKIIKKIIADNFVILIPLVIFTFLLFPFFNLPACNDAGTEYNKSTTFYGLGLEGYLHAGSLHPPFKPFVASIFYTILGQNIFSYHMTGLFVGYLGIIGIYFLCKNVFNKNVGLIAATLLSTFPLFLANALDNYTDYFVTVFSILSLYFYSRNKLFIYAIIASCTVLSKDTGLLLPLSVLLIELYSAVTRKSKIIAKIKRLSLSIFPLLIYFVWYEYVRMNGVEVFSQYIFAETGDRGAFVTIIYNLLTLNFFHQYAQNHIQQLLYLNFTWVYWLIILFGVVSMLRRTRFIEIKTVIQNKIKSLLLIMLFFVLFGIVALLFQIIFTVDRSFHIDFTWLFWPTAIVVLFSLLRAVRINRVEIVVHLEDPKVKTILAMVLFFVTYALTVVTFQIWNTPRYNLPMIPLIIISASFVLNKYITKIPIFIILVLSVINFISLFFSVDPISIALWNRGSASGQTFYTINQGFIGDDAVYYNLQYLLTMKKRTDTFATWSTKVCTLNN